MDQEDHVNITMKWKAAMKYQLSKTTVIKSRFTKTSSIIIFHFSRSSRMSNKK
jgi:hypothetical protein